MECCNSVNVQVSRSFNFSHWAEKYFLTFSTPKSRTRNRSRDATPRGRTNDGKIRATAESPGRKDAKESSELEIPVARLRDGTVSKCLYEDRRQLTATDS